MYTHCHLSNALYSSTLRVNMSRPIAFITGASSGIGAAMATVLAEAGHDLVLVARRADRLAALAERLSDAGASSETLTVDLSEKAGLKRAVERAAAGDIDVLVSNAGVSAYGPFAEIDPGELDRAWTLNADVTPVLARAALPGMLGRGRGGIISVASNLAFSAGADQPRVLTRRRERPAQVQRCHSARCTWELRQGRWLLPEFSHRSCTAPGCRQL
ncbi:SDR family NAD(P)-dependent oxidoreductase [Glutamicibacter sp. M10]|uniref:SDR family NAD(P)-dependent oxidoreductase n=1 Tax=Glutamicibacter sp. M10 TaxID=3023076 RepID=UPI0037C09B40